MFCTPADFNLLPYNIPNLNQVVNTFQPYVDAAEEDMLRKLLGSQLYTEFMAELNDMPDEWDSTITYGIGTQVVYGVDIWQALQENLNEVPGGFPSWELIEEGNKWLTLEKGNLFIYDTWQFEWAGMKDMLKPFIFSIWTRDTYDNNSGIGVVQAKAENAEVIAPSLRIVRAWNVFSEKADIMFMFIQSTNVKPTDAPEDWLPVYENWHYCPPGTMNHLNL